jgi:hypothetical protein
MSKISTYNNASPVTLSDRLIGTSVGATPANATKNFLVSDLLALFEGNVTLEDALLAGNTSTTAMILGGSLRINSGLLDASGGLGTSGQSLLSTGTAVSWGDPSVGKLSLPVRYAEAVAKGDPLYISGYNVGQSRLEVSKADSASASTMPAIGLADAAYAMNDNGNAVSIGTLTGIDLSSLVPAPSVGDVLYIASGGGLTKTAPTGTALIQNVGIVSRNSGANGVIEVTAIGRANALPNITPSSVLFGGTAGQASESLRLTYTEQDISQGATAFAGKTEISTGLLKLPQLQTFSDNTTALAGDLIVGDVYRDNAGGLRVVI